VIIKRILIDIGKEEEEEELTLENEIRRDSYIGFKNHFLNNHLGGGPVVKTWDQKVCSPCGLKFEPCGCSYDGRWRLTWSLTSGPVRLVEVRAS
jgi:hypothetical protein